MKVAEGVDKLTGLAAKNFCKNNGQKRVACNIERHAKKDVGTALVELQAHFAVFNIHLIEIMANRKACAFSLFCHAIEILWIPGGNERVVRVGVFAELVNY